MVSDFEFSIKSIIIRYLFSNKYRNTDVRYSNF